MLLFEPVLDLAEMRSTVVTRFCLFGLLLIVLVFIFSSLFFLKTLLVFLILLKLRSVKKADICVWRRYSLRFAVFKREFDFLVWEFAHLNLVAEFADLIIFDESGGAGVLMLRIRVFFERAE